MDDGQIITRLLKIDGVLRAVDRAMGGTGATKITQRTHASRSHEYNQAVRGGHELPRPTETRGSRHMLGRLKVMPAASR